MAITINGTGTITGISAGGLPDNCVTAADIESSLDLTGKTVTLPSGTGGKVLNVWQVNKTDQQIINSTSYQTIMSQTLTPASASSKFLIITSVSACSQTTDVTMGYFSLFKGTDELLRGDASGNRPRTYASLNVTSNEMVPLTLQYLDSPATTDEITYSVQCRRNNSNANTEVWINRTDHHRDVGGNYDPVGASTFTIMEIG